MDKFKSFDLKQSVEAMHWLQTELAKIKEVKKTLQEELDFLRLNKIPDLMDEDGINNINFEGIGRVSLTSDIYSSIPAPLREKAYQWLRDNKHSGLIVETVHPGTLKAFLKGEIKKGNNIPEEIFKVTPFSRASITKK